MKKYLTIYLKYLEDVQADSSLSADELKKIRSEMLVQIGFMQHERLIHLIVTVLFAILLFVSLGIAVSAAIPAFLLLTLLILVLLVPYIAHYYFLENSVQKLYDIYNAVTERIDNFYG